MRNGLRLVITTGLLLLVGCDNVATDATGGPVAMRRLTPAQYTNAVEDAFGKSVQVAGRFEPDSRRDGLNALGASLVAVTPSGFEQYEAMARNIALQVTSEELRDTILPCEPADPTAADDTCTTQVLQQFGRTLLRRPLSPEDIQSRVTAAAAVASEQEDFYAGLRLAITSLMVAPDFLFRVEVAEPAPLPEQPSRLALTDISLASKLSYFLWNRGPDEELLAVAERGELSDPAVLNAQVDRMLASPLLATAASWTARLDELVSGVVVVVTVVVVTVDAGGGSSSWRIEAALAPGTHTLAVGGDDRGGAAIAGSTDTITVTVSSSTSPAARNRWMVTPPSKYTRLIPSACSRLYNSCGASLELLTRPAKSGAISTGPLLSTTTGFSYGHAPKLSTFSYVFRPMTSTSTEAINSP